MKDSTILVFLLLSCFTATVYLSATLDAPGMWRQLPLREKVLCAFLLIVSSLILFSYVFNISSIQGHALLSAR
ncbi:MAG: hypothetical protein ACREQ7_10190 [Candidatus Binatia bacterium]